MPVQPSPGSLLEVYRPELAFAHLLLFSESLRHDVESSRHPLALVEGRSREADAGDVELYDVASDPGELHDLAAERPDDVARLRARLLELAGDFGPGERVAPPELDEETRRQLRELGYTE